MQTNSKKLVVCWEEDRWMGRVYRKQLTEILARIKIRTNLDTLKDCIINLLKVNPNGIDGYLYFAEHQLAIDLALVHDTYFGVIIHLGKIGNPQDVTGTVKEAETLLYSTSSEALRSIVLEL